jgi:DNA-binding transcriptional LysR family regulator
MSRDLNDTLLFVRVVEQGSFTAAARLLGLPKATVSRKVRDLEDRLGARLLNRTTRRLSLTEAGTVYFERSKRIAEDLDEAENAVHQLEGSPRGWLRVTAPYALGVTLLGPILPEFRKRYPDVRLDIVLSSEILDLVGGEIDVALRVGSLPDSSLSAHRLTVFETQVVASTGYLARHGEPLVPEDLENHHALVVAPTRRGEAHAWRLSNGERDEAFPVRPAFVANDPYLLRSMLFGHQGLMLTSTAIARDTPPGVHVRPVLASWRGPGLELNAVFVGGRVISPRVRVFVDFIAECLRERWPSGDFPAPRQVTPPAAASG